MKQPTYQEAIDWIAGNCDTEWVSARGEALRTPSVEAALVIDLFGVSERRVRRDIRHAIPKFHN